LLPDALSVAVSPKHIAGGEGVMLATGIFTVIVIEAWAVQTFVAVTE
jgi:hypothetical protein